MGNGFQRKIDNIVSNIVDSEKLNNNKIDETDISESIKKAISDLNDTGKILVLDDLSKEAGQTPSKLLTLDGKISIEKLKEVVNAKVVEAEREGINLNSGEPVFKDNKITMAEGVLTIAVIDSMIKDYDKLSSAEKESLSKNWKNMLPAQKQEYATALSNSLKNIKTESKEDNKKLKDIAEQVENLPSESKHRNNSIELMSEEDTKKLYHALFRDSDTPKDTKQMKKEIMEKYEKFDEGFIESAQRCEIAPTEKNIDEGERNTHIQKFLNLLINNPQIDKEINLSDFEKMPTGKQDIIIRFYTKKLNEKMKLEDFLKLPNEKLKEYLPDNEESASQQQNHQPKPEDLIKTEIEQIPSALAKSGFSQEQIKEALTEYKNFFGQLEEDDFLYLSELSDKKLVETLTSEFEDIETSETSKSILKMMSNLTFNGNLKQILANPKARENFLQQFDQVINQEQMQSQDVQLTGELEEIFTQYFNENAKEMDVSAIEEQKKQQAQEQSEQENTVETNEPAKEEKEPKENLKEEPAKPENETKEPVGQTIQEENTQSEEQVATSVTSTASVQAPPEEHIPKTDGVQSQEVESQETALEIQDNSFIGKVKRFMANMRDMKNKDSSKGFFARFKSSFKTVFGNNENEAYFEEDNVSANGQSKQDSKKEQQSFIPQVTVNERLAVSQTEEQKNEKQAQAIAQDRNKREENQEESEIGG